ncbi:hypothetical protein GJ698_05380 [Pseudoduganella sp. FT26W]|uniref:Uncharacterized protein n=1 Tax=Duganella aquatilis TaxID=2666082 RepID=A0A844D4F3_9BURK|nr:hypothetical protein [Duganella aquatilis]MRW83522.1 hypothetical protein [Duganella aquatilis]
MRPRVSSDYHYRAPPDLNNGIAVGTLADSDIGVAVGEKIVRCILDETWRVNPGGVAHYCSGGVVVVGRATESAVKMALPDFARDASSRSCHRHGCMNR